jgi:hypothetical protein
MFALLYGGAWADVSTMLSATSANNGNPGGRIFRWSIGQLDTAAYEMAVASRSVPELRTGFGAFVSADSQSSRFGKIGMLPAKKLV